MKTFMTMLFVLFATFLFVTQASAGCHYKHKHHKHHYCKTMCRPVVPAPSAVCHVEATNQILPTYTCCKLAVYSHCTKKYLWRNTWVSGGCANADPRAKGDYGCSTTSPVFGTNGPIMATCQFSANTKQ